MVNLRKRSTLYLVYTLAKFGWIPQLAASTVCPAFNFLLFYFTYIVITPLHPDSKHCPDFYLARHFTLELAADLASLLIAAHSYECDR